MIYGCGVGVSNYREFSLGFLRFRVYRVQDTTTPNPNKGPRKTTDLAKVAYVGYHVHVGEGTEQPASRGSWVSTWRVRGLSK